MRKTKFTQDDFSFICPMKWEYMKAVDKGRFCDKCEQTVIDVSDCSLDEVATMQRKDPAICVAIKTLATVATTTGVALSIAACSSTPPPAPIHVTAGVPIPFPQNTQQSNKQDTKKTTEQKKRQALSAKLLKSKTHCQLPKPNKTVK